MSRASKPNEVVKVEASEVLRLSLPPFSHVEVRERRDGSWGVFYPDPGWIPCSPVCRLTLVQRSHKHDYEQNWVESKYSPTSYADALEWATLLAEGREVKTMAYTTAAERKRQRQDLT